MAKNPLIVDLSHHNTVTSFGAIKDGGTIGIIHKATEGTTYVDPMYAPRRSAAQSAGLLWASYHFLKHGSIDAQMQNYIRTVNPYIGERMIIDYEDPACTLDDLRLAIKYLQANAPHTEITVYAGHLIKEQLGNTADPLLATTSLWIAQYTTAATPSWPKGTWKTYTLWQYTDSAPCTGIGASGKVDGNRFNGSDENAAKWFHPAAASDLPVPPAPPAPAEATVQVDIKAPEGVKVVFTVNGAVVS